MIALVVLVIGLLAATWAGASLRTVPEAPIDAVPEGPLDDSAGTAGSAISVIVPARNEERSLPVLLASLAGSVHPPSEIIVVDDSSTDATSAVAIAAGATVVAAAPPPDGWLGKPWACSTGARAATNPTLIFLDADTRLAPGALDRLTALHRTTGGLCSVQPFHTPGRLVEELSALFNASAVLGSGQFTAMRGRDGRVGNAVAFGPCLVTSQADYRAVGGHGAVRESVIEDIALAAAYRSHGLATTCWLGGDTISFRMYPDGFRSLVEGWTKNIALGARTAAGAAVAATMVWIAALVWIATSTVAGAVDWVGGGTAPISWFGAWVAMSLHLWWLLGRLGSFRPLTALLFPIPLLFFVVVFLRSAMLVALRRPVRWRGRTVANGGSSR